MRVSSPPPPPSQQCSERISGFQVSGTPTESGPSQNEQEKRTPSRGLRCLVRDTHASSEADVARRTVRNAAGVACRQTERARPSPRTTRARNGRKGERASSNRPRNRIPSGLKARFPSSWDRTVSACLCAKRTHLLALRGAQLAIFLAALRRCGASNASGLVPPSLD